MAGIAQHDSEEWDKILKGNLNNIDEQTKALEKKQALLKEDRSEKLGQLKEKTALEIAAAKEDLYRKDKKAAAAAAQNMKEQQAAIKRLEKEANKIDSTSKDVAEMEDKLRKEWSGSPVTKDTQVIASSYQKIQEVQDNPSPAGDISLIFNYMKMLDPASVVREGEQATAASAAAVPDRIRNAYNLLIEGEKLTPNQRKDFVNKARSTYKGQLAVQKTVDDKIRRVIKKRGLDESMVIDESLSGLRNKQSSEPEAKKATDPKVQEYADKYFDGDYNSALDLLKKRGYKSE